MLSGATHPLSSPSQGCLPRYDVILFLLLHATGWFSRDSHHTFLVFKAVLTLHCIKQFLAFQMSILRTCVVLTTTVTPRTSKYLLCEREKNTSLYLGNWDRIKLKLSSNVHIQATGLPLTRWDYFSWRVFLPAQVLLPNCHSDFCLDFLTPFITFADSSSSLTGGSWRFSLPCRLN